MLLKEDKIKIKKVFEQIGFTAHLYDIQCLYIEFVLEKNNWNKTHTAKALHVPLRTLREWCLRSLPIEIPEDKKWKK